MAPAAPTPDWVKKLTASNPQGHELLAQERSLSSLPVKKLSRFLFTQEAIDRKRRVLKVLQNERVFDKSQNYFAGRIDRFEAALARAKRLRQLTVQHGWDEAEYRAAIELISEPGPYGLHDSMYEYGIPACATAANTFSLSGSW